MAERCEFSRQSVMDFMTDARFPKELRDEYGGIPAARWDSVSRQAGIVGGAEQWSERLKTLQSDLQSDGDEPDWVKDRIADVGVLERFIADLHARLSAHPGRAPWAEHLDDLQSLLGRYVAHGDQVIEALRGLERFTALETEVEHKPFLEVVRRAVETLRSEDVLDGQPGAFARRGVNVVAVNSLAGCSSSVCGCSERPSAHFRHRHGRTRSCWTPRDRLGRDLRPDHDHPRREGTRVSDLLSP